ncbi:hypothetical protein DYH09_26880 [bacterium CPR1]|nr:hypothetical protein [bacterium CPR1]
MPPGDRVKLKSGTYYISNTFSADGAEIDIDSAGGPVILYVGYQMDLKNTKINNVNPRDLQIYFTDEVPPEVLATMGTSTGGGVPTGFHGEPTEPTGGSGSADLNPGSLFNVEGGSGTFVAAGKDTTITLKNTEVFGSVVGQVVTANASSIHYDKNLKGMPLGGVSDWILEGLHETTR